VTTRDFAHALEHMGLQHRFVSSEEVRRGDLHNGDYRVLILPHTIAMAPSAAKEIRDFVEHGGVVVADGEPGIFDEHGRRAAKPLLSEIFVGAATRSATGFVFGKGKAIYLALSNDRHRESTRRLAGILDAAGVKPRFPLVHTDGRPVNDVETHIFDNREATIVALQRDYSLPSNLGHREPMFLALPHQFSAYDLRRQRALGIADRLEVELGPVEPALLALSEKPILAPSISGPHSVHLGTNAEFLIHPTSPATLDVVHLDVIDPEGSSVAQYSGNLLAAGASVATKLVPFAFNDKPGIWKLRARDLLSGATATAELLVEP